ncbi:MAG TPA: sodium:solute symporter family protein, partial [Polyangia bacterium]|nr:sodium:solute symporter family protein [Polyangia bacterium]
MHPVDASILVLYMLAMLGVGAWFLRRNTGTEDYYVGGRRMGSLHVGLSVVATDVGGGFSIGLGGLGFAIGIAGSWMLFTGLVGAWLSAVLLIPRIKRDPELSRGMTFPDMLGVRYGPTVALAAAVISAIGYLGFTASQILAGAKLAAGVFPEIGVDTALLAMGAVAVGYTVMGGLKAVIYTDTIQWILLMAGLILIGIPLSWQAVGGWEAIERSVGPEMLSLTNVGWRELVNWGITIIPIWFVGMTLYQRVHACRDEKTARRAWYLAGLFEWPVMALMGATLGLLARVAAEQGLLAMPGGVPPEAADPEIGLPLLLSQVLPVGLLGLVMAAYFSAILSTADS